ncbi:MAG: amidohydrolase family protein [Oceanicoccus sp.]
MKKIALSLCTISALLFLWVLFQLTFLPAFIERGITPSPKIVITNVHLIPMSSSTPEVLKHQTITIENGKITSIGKADEQEYGADISLDTLVIDGKGQYLLPGLIDAHVHLSDESELAGYLSYGVTAIRNMSGYPFHVGLQTRIERRELLAPDFITTGPILNSPGPNANIIQQLVHNKEDAIRAVRRQHEAGFNTVKLYSNLTKPAFSAIVKEARNLNMKITGHSPEGTREKGMPHDKPFTIPWEASIGKGFETLEHTETLVWHALSDKLSISEMVKISKLLVESGDVIVPTLVAHKRLVNIAESKGKYLNQTGSKTINPLVKLIEKGSMDYWSHKDVSSYERPHTDFFAEATEILHSNGVKMIVGTDAGGFGLVPGKSMLEELQLLVDSGISPYDTLRAATSISADVLGFEKTGKILSGHTANLILVPENPLENMEALKSISGIMLHGEWLESDDIDALKQAASNTSFTRSLVRAADLLWFIY